MDFFTDGGTNELMYVDVQPRRAMLVAFSAAFAFLIFGFLVGVAGPDALISTEYFAYECEDNSHVWDPATCAGTTMNSNDSYWTGEISDLSDLYQLWTLNMTLENPSMQSRNIVGFKADIDLSVRDPSVSPTYEPQEVDDPDPVDLVCREGEQWCDPFTLVMEPYLVYPDYKVTVRVPNPDPDIDWIGDVGFTFTVINPAYSLLTLTCRLLFFIVSLVVLFLYVSRLGGCRTKAATARWTYEQKVYLLLLVSSLFLDNPLRPFDFAVHGWFFFTITSFCDVFHDVAVLFFLLSIFDKYRRPADEEMNVNRFYFPKVLALVIYGGLAAIMYMIVSVALEADPVEAWTSGGDSAFLDVFIVILGLHIAILVWVLVLVVLAGLRMRNSEVNFQRYLFVMIPSVVLVICLVFGVLTNSLGVITKTSLQFTFFFSLRNAYIYILAAGYWPMTAGQFKLFREADRVPGRPADGPTKMPGEGESSTNRETVPIMSGAVNPSYASENNPFA